jgi:hypothetical protein
MKRLFLALMNGMSGRQWTVLMCGSIFLIRPVLIHAQSLSPFGPSAATLNGTGRALEDVLTQVKMAFQYPIYYEELPLENSGDVRVAQAPGFKAEAVSPVSSLSVTLSGIDSTPYLAVQSVLSAYAHAGYPAEYRVIQHERRLEVVPFQVRATDGSGRAVTPILSLPISFPVATRTAVDTLQLMVDSASKQSGYKIVIIRAPTPHFQNVEMGATGEAFGDALEKMSAALSSNYSISLRYVIDTKTYYLDAGPSSPPDPPGLPATHGKKSTPTNGPANSPFFTKSN